MRSWMIGMVIGILTIAFTPILPPSGLLLFFAVLLMLPRFLPLTIGSRYYWVSGAVPRAFLLGVLAGMLWASFQAHNTLRAGFPEACNRKALAVSGEIVSTVRSTVIREQLKRQRFEFVPDGPLPEDCGQPRKLLLSYYGEHSLEAGQRWRFSVALRRPWGLSNPGSFNIQSWFALRGVDAVGSVRSGGEFQLARAQGLTSLHHRLRARVSTAIAGVSTSESGRAILRAITVADKSGIDTTLWQLFQQYGVNHLLVISGLHIGLAAGVGYLLGVALARLGLLLGLVRVPRGVKLASFKWCMHGLAAAPQLLALVVATAYAALAGFSLSTQRALVMLACFSIASLLGRPSSGLNNLLLAALILLSFNPLAAIGSGFWLSFGAVAALLWLARWQRGISRGLRLLRTHGYMSVVMIPLGGVWFGGASWASAPANFIAIPLLGLWVVPVSLLGTVLSLLGSDSAVLLWQFAVWPLQSLLSPAMTLAQTMPFYLPLSLQGGAVLLAVGAVVGLVLPIRRRDKFLLLVLLAPLLLPLQPEVAGPRLIALDVGQGTAVVFTDGDQTLLYDTGGGDPAGANIAQSVILPFLRSQGIQRLDMLVISHGDTDHSAGLGAVLRQIPVDQVRYGKGVADLGDGAPCRAGAPWRWKSGIHFQFLSPLAETEQLPGFTSTNDNSCVLRIDVGNARIILAGDIESDRERALVRYWGDELRSEVLLVAHHGSRTSTTGAWLNSVRPKVAIVSSGYASRFGHPHSSVVERLQGRGADVHTTALEGALEVSFGGDSQLAISAHRGELKPWWM